MPKPIEHFRGVVANFPLADPFGDVGDVIAALASVSFLDGTFCHCARREIRGETDLSALQKIEGLEIDRTETSLDRKGLKVAGHGDGFACHITVWRRSTTVNVYAETAELAASVVGRIAQVVPAPPEASADEVKVTFHHAGDGHGISSTTRHIAAPTWSDIVSNYTDDARSGLDRLMRHEKPEGLGRLVLLHGAPGTGKTTAIRSLARAWAPWCDTSYVMDPEVLFNRSAYLNELVVDGDTSDDETSDRWRLLIIEDADEIISANARDRAGQALSRLLNLTDGMLGQGLRALILITTNEPMSSLHPAISRPGRCLADIEVGPFDPDGARRWIGPSHAGLVPAHPITLAELFALRDGAAPVQTSRPGVSTGQYL